MSDKLPGTLTSKIDKLTKLAGSLGFDLKVSHPPRSHPVYKLFLGSSSLFRSFSSLESLYCFLDGYNTARNITHPNQVDN